MIINLCGWLFLRKNNFGFASWSNKTIKGTYVIFDLLLQRCFPDTGLKYPSGHGSQWPIKNRDKSNRENKVMCCMHYYLY
jgi:hypothetical protein